MVWNKIDLFPAGKSGFDAKWRIDEDRRDVIVFIGGSDHWSDWLHHFTPGAKKREIEAAEAIFEVIREKVEDAISVFIGGHSVGGVIACCLGEMTQHKAQTPTYVCLFGSKRIWWNPEVDMEHYVRRGDIVPLLPPWRREYRKLIVYGKRLPFWKAHGPSTYYPEMEMLGLR